MTKTGTKKGVIKHANSYGNIDVRQSLPKGYCHVSKIKGINIQHWLKKMKTDYLKALVGFENSRYGTKPVFDGVVIASRSRSKVLAIIEQKQKEKERRKQKQEEKRNAAAIEKLASQYPRLDRDIICQLVSKSTRVFSRDTIGYQFGYGTKSYWNDLGFRVDGNPAGCLIRGKQIYLIYSVRSLIPKRSKITVRQLRRKWLKKYGSPVLMFANALRFANKLQKVKRISEVYDLKDDWIRANQGNLTEGKITRVEEKECWSCDGKGYFSDYEDDFDDECDRCGGTGLYSQRTLYEHNFEIDGHMSCFHSYSKPIKLSESKGADLKNYGRPFTKDELPLPPQHLIVDLIQELMSKSQHS
ncbi:hypothetical protein [Gimesia panareensis]|uniref:hypothetical protein n=1 Tax=Gimesia panareensis TaxID=2527978 RepID=UPI001187C6DF|nr:hypothetical protein [Gimesia panareensis]QDU50510.1 Rad4 beta-hairpin domain 3 [Gimesia panareensis]